MHVHAPLPPPLSSRSSWEKPFQGQLSFDENCARPKTSVLVNVCPYTCGCRTEVSPQSTEKAIWALSSTLKATAGPTSLLLDFQEQNLAAAPVNRAVPFLTS